MTSCHDIMAVSKSNAELKHYMVRYFSTIYRSHLDPFSLLSVALTNVISLDYLPLIINFCHKNINFKVKNLKTVDSEIFGYYLENKVDIVLIS